MKRCLLYAKCILRLGIIRGLWHDSCEWYYDYNELKEDDILLMMATILANRDGNVHQFALCWQSVKKRHFASHKDIDAIEAKFYRKLGLNVPQGL